MKISANLRNTFHKMGFIKRSIITLALGFFAALACAIAFDTLYRFLANNSGVAIAAGLIGSQVWLYKPDVARVAKNTKSGTPQDSPSNNQTQQPERQAVPHGCADASSRVSLEEEAREVGNDFSSTGEELGAEEDPEVFEDP